MGAGMKKYTSRAVCTAFISALIVSCASGYRPMPTAVYEEPDLTQFNDLQKELKSPEINLLFVTDRKWDTADGGQYTGSPEPEGKNHIPLQSGERVYHDCMP